MVDAPHPDFVGYVGPSELHDATIETVEESPQQVLVGIRSCDGHRIAVAFDHPVRVISNHPVGMMLYALVETRGDEPNRRFIFVNWDEDDEAVLEIVAQDFEVIDTDNSGN